LPDGGNPQKSWRAAGKCVQLSVIWQLLTGVLEPFSDNML
jgi:hypothetical protein